MEQKEIKNHEVDISIVIPAYNEEKGIGEVLNKLQETTSKIDSSFEIIVVDDGSTDATFSIVKKKEIGRLVQHPYNKGYGAAIKTGIKNANGDLILIIDADNTYPINDIPHLLEFTNEYDMVVGARIGKNVNVPLVRRPGKFILSKLANYLSGVDIPDLNSGFRIFKKEIGLRYYNLFPSGFSFTTTITLACLTNSEYNVKYMPIDYYKRTGTSKIHVFKDGMKFILLIIKTIIYFDPLKVFLPVSFFLFFLAPIVFLFSYFVLNRVPDVTIAILLSGALQIAILGLIADLIVKERG